MYTYCTISAFIPKRTITLILQYLIPACSIVTVHHRWSLTFIDIYNKIICSVRGVDRYITITLHAYDMYSEK